LISDTRQQILFHCLRDFHEGILASVFDSLDRIQHMFWRDRQDIVEQWYERLDRLVGRVELYLAKNGTDTTKIVVVSDHGFADFNFKVHLNRWLIEQGFLTPKKEAARGDIQQVDWSRSQAYAIGLNSIYLNLSGREGQGSVASERVAALTQKLRDALLSWRGPNGRPVANRVWTRDEIFSGPLASHGPDLLVGYAPGYRASSQTGLGAWEELNIEPNHDHWGADHCIDPAAVPGVLFCNQGLRDFPSPSYQDIPMLTIGEEPDTGRPTPPPSFTDEEREVVEERLRSLGYL
jgi:predicted AlkP superfamily phosphohydrolase/phosphomutase